MNTKLLHSSSREQFGNPDLEIIPRIGEKVYYMDVMYQVSDIVHTPTAINILLNALPNRENLDVEVDWD